MSKVVPKKFINNPPSNYDTIYTVLLAGDRKCKAKIKNIFLTFDQPLYIKAREIVACKDADDDNLTSIIIRLGGFHAAMSFLRSIGY